MPLPVKLGEETLAMEKAAAFPRLVMGQGAGHIFIAHGVSR